MDKRRQMDEALRQAGFEPYQPQSNVVPPPKDVNHPHYRRGDIRVSLDYFANSAVIRVGWGDVLKLLTPLLSGRRGTE